MVQKETEALAERYGCAAVRAASAVRQLVRRFRVLLAIGSWLFADAPNHGRSQEPGAHSTISPWSSFILTHYTCASSILALILVFGYGSGAPAEDATPASKPTFLYLPPLWAERVVFYHSFEKGVDQPEINLLNGTLRGEKTAAAEGLTGRAYRAPNPKEKKAALQLDSPALSPNRPLTVMLWYRLDAPMKEETSFQLIRIGGKGHIASFVHGKGEWCALKEPTYISQVHGFPEIRNHHNSWGGRVWFEPGTWHHAAVTVANASEVRIYWDGQLREEIGIKGRLFQEGDCSWVHLDPNWLYHPMSIDEVVICDRALTAGEIAQYVRAVQALAERKYPVAVRQ